MASRYWVGGTDTWNSTAGSKWSTTSGGAGGSAVPGSNDDVFFDASSGAGTVTLASAGAVKSIDCTGFTGTWSGSSARTVNGSYKLVAGMTYSWTGALTFNGTGTMNLTSAGQTLRGMTMSGSGGTLSFQDNVTMNSISTISHTNGTIALNSAVVTGGSSFSSTGSNSRSINTGTSQLTFSSAWTISGSNCVINLAGGGNFCSITLNGANATFTGGGLAYDWLYLTGSGTATVKGANTFKGLQRVGTASKTDVFAFDADQTVTTIFQGTGESATNRMLIRSTLVGTQRTLNVSVANQGHNAMYHSDVQDIAAGGTGPWDMSGGAGLSGDCGNNTGITFTTAGSQYWYQDTGNFSDASKWFGASGGVGSSTRVPLPQDNVIFDAGSFSAGSKTVTFDMPRTGSIDWTGVTENPTLLKTANVTCYGSLTLASGMVSAGGSTWTWGGRGSNTLTNSGVSWGNASMSVDCGGGSIQLQDDFVTTSGGSPFTMLSGTFDANNNDLTLNQGLDLSITTNPRTVTMGSGTWTISAASGTILNVVSTNLTLNQNTSTIVISNTSASAKTVAGGGETFYNIQVNGATGAGTVSFTGANTFNNITLDPKSNVKFPSGVTTTTSGFSATGSAGNVITIAASTNGSAATLSCANNVNCDYISLKDSAATGGGTFHAGANSTNVSGNSGWAFP